MTSTKEKLQRIKQTKYRLEFGEVLNDSLENYKKIIWIAGFAFFLLTVIMVVFFFGALAFFTGASTLIDTMTDMGNLEMSPSYLLVTLIAGVIVATAISPLYAGIFQVCHNAQTSKPFDVNTVFMHYKTNFRKQIVISALLISLSSAIITDLITLAGFPFIGNLFTYFAQFITLFTLPFILFENMNAIEAIQASIITVFKKFWLILGLMIVSVILAMLGMIAICIGIFFTLPIIYTTEYAIYRRMIGIDEKDELDEIGINIE